MQVPNPTTSAVVSQKAQKDADQFGKSYTRGGKKAVLFRSVLGAPDSQKAENEVIAHGQSRRCVHLSGIILSARKENDGGCCNRFSLD